MLFQDQRDKHIMIAGKQCPKYIVKQQHNKRNNNSMEINVKFSPKLHVLVVLQA